MVVPGFHYFVAWRYLMTRPRRVSVPTFTVVTVLLVMSIAVAALGRYVVPVPPKFGLLPLGTPAHLIRAAGVVFFAMAGATIAGGLCAHVGRNPRRLFVPVSAPLALMAGAVAVIGLHGYYQLTLALACAALAPSIVIYVLGAPAVERALVSLLVVFFGGAGAACMLLGSRAEHMIILDNRWVLASFGLVLLGVLLTISLWLTYVNRRPRSISVLLAGLAPLAIGAGALCASLAHPTVDLFRRASRPGSHGEPWWCPVPGSPR